LVCVPDIDIEGDAAAVQRNAAITVQHSAGPRRHCKFDIAFLMF
jgi:hypothetical protein